MRKVLIIAFGVAILGLVGGTQSAFASKKCHPSHCRVVNGFAGPVYVCDPGCTPKKTHKSRDQQSHDHQSGPGAKARRVN